MNWDPIVALVSIIFGILIIAFPDLLGILVGILLILVGLWLLYDYFISSGRKTTSTNKAPQAAQEAPAPPHK